MIVVVVLVMLVVVVKVVLGVAVGVALRMQLFGLLPFSNEVFVDGGCGGHGGCGDD